MKNMKKLLLLAAVFALAGCNGGQTSSSSSSETSSSMSSSVSSSTSSEETFDTELFGQVKDTINALGNNYYASDYYFSFSGDQVFVSMNEMVTTPKGVLNMSTKSGMAIAKNSTGATKGYRFQVDFDAEGDDSATMFLPSYHEAYMVYDGFNTDQSVVVEMNQENYDFLYSVPTVNDIQSLSDSYHNALGLRKPKFNNMFEQGVDADGYVTFTTTNFAVAQVFLENFSYGRLEGYSSMYNSEAYELLFSSVDTTDLSGTQTIFTVIDMDTYIALDVQVILSAFAEDTPYIERTLVALSQVPTEEVADYDYFSNIVPETFYEEGPGEEPEDVKTKRAAFKAQLEDLMEYNYTINFTGGADLFASAQYTAKVVSPNAFSFGDGTSIEYTYYYIPYDAENGIDKTEAGVYVYDTTANEGEKEYCMVTLQDYIDSFVNYYGATLLEDGVTVSITSSGQTMQINVEDYLESIYRDNYDAMYLLTEEFNAGFAAQEGAEGLNYWEYNYGGDWIDQFIYNPNNETFVTSNYYIKAAFLGACYVFTMEANSVSCEFIPATTEGEYPLVTADYYYGQYLDFGYVIYSDVGTTALSNESGTYINTKYNTNYPVQAA